jgi:hypothetical protein
MLRKANGVAEGACYLSDRHNVELEAHLVRTEHGGPAQRHNFDVAL